MLPPTDQRGNVTNFCAQDIYSNPNISSVASCKSGAKTAFCQAIADVGENSTSLGTKWGSWGWIPEERKKLLQKAQMAAIL